MTSIAPIPSTRDRVISVVAILLSLGFLVLGFASYVYPALASSFIVLSTVGTLFLTFLQVFPRFTLSIPGLHFRLIAKWVLIPICVLSLFLNAFLLVNKENTVNSHIPNYTVTPISTVASLSPTSSATARPTSTATPMPTPRATPISTFVPTPTQETQAQSTPLPVVNVKFFHTFVYKQQVVLSDFSSRNWPNKPQTSGTCAITDQSQTMMATSAGPAFSCLYNSPFLPVSFALQTQIKVTKGSEAGLTFNNIQNGTTQSYDLYKANINNGKWYFNTGTVNVNQNQQASGSGAGNQTNVLGIVVYKQTLYLYVNDVLKYTQSNFSNGGGTIGMYIGADSSATYTQPTVWQLAPNLNIGN